MSADASAIPSFLIPSFLGSGFRSYASEIGSRIIDHAGLKEIPPEDARVESQFGLVISQEDFESVFSADASVAGSMGAFSAKARASFRKEFSRSQTSVSIAFTRKVVTGIFRLFEYPVTKQAAKDAHDPARFVRAFGDSLVTGIGMGGSCCYLFKYDFRTESEAREFRLAISARYGSGSGGYSQEQREKVEKSQAIISFSGYTTGTLNVPSLFDPDAINGTNFLFSAAFSARMISGLLRYYDEFPKNFTMGTVDTGYSQCEQEVAPLSLVPKILTKQDEIADIGNQMRIIASALRIQRDYLDALDGQLAYMEAVSEQNLPAALKESVQKRQAIPALMTKIDNRLSTLIQKNNLKDAYDFRAQFPALLEHYCTADPDIRKIQFGSPRKSWAYREFSLTPADDGKTCWIEATANIIAVGHRPNGGSLFLVLYKAPLPTVRATVDIPTVDSNTTNTVWEEVEKYSVTIARGGCETLRVGGITFVPGQDKVVYRIGVYTDGDYRGGSTVYMTTKVSRQTTIIA